MAVSTLLKLCLNNKWSCNNPFSCSRGLRWTYAKIFLSPSSAEEVCWDSPWSAERPKEQVRIKFFSYVFCSVKLICGISCLIAHKISRAGGNTELYDFLNRGIHVKEEISQKWTLVDWNSFCFYLRRTFRGGGWCVGPPMLRFTNTPASPQTICGRPKSCQRNSLRSSNYRVEQFPDSFSASGDTLPCKFCPHRVDWKQTCWW